MIVPEIGDLFWFESFLIGINGWFEYFSEATLQKRVPRRFPVPATYFAFERKYP